MFLHKLMVVVTALLLSSVSVAAAGSEMVPTMVLKWSVPSPLDVAVDHSGRVYVACSDSKIRVFDTEGNRLFEWGSAGSANGQFNGLADIAISPSGEVVAADSGNDRVQVFDAGGNYLRKWGTPCMSHGPCVGEYEQRCFDPDGDGPLELGDGQLSDPNSIDVDEANDVYVYEVGKHHIQIFDASGNFLRKVGPHPPNCSGEDWIIWPSSVAVDGTGAIFVGQTTGLVKFSSAGTFLWKNTDVEYPNGIAFDANGDLYFGSENRAYKYSPDGQQLYWWGSYCNMSTGEGCIDPDGPGALEVGDGQFYGVSLDVDTYGNIYAADYVNNRVQKFRWLPIAVTPTTWSNVKTLYR